MFQVPYVRKRDHPQFDGIRRSDSTVPLQKNKHNPLENVVKSSLSRSLSDIWEFESKQKTPGVAENVVMNSVKEDFNEDIQLDDAKPIDEEDIETLNGSRKNINVHKIYLPQCAASYYKGNLPQNEVSVLCKSMDKLNRYLKSSKDEIRAGVPGRYLNAVMSQEIMGNFIINLPLSFLYNSDF